MDIVTVNGLVFMSVSALINPCCHLCSSGVVSLTFTQSKVVCSQIYN